MPAIIFIGMSAIILFGNVANYSFREYKQFRHASGDSFRQLEIRNGSNYIFHIVNNYNCSNIINKCTTMLATITLRNASNHNFPK